METKEFIKRVEELGFKVKKSGSKWIEIIGGKRTVASLTMDEMYCLDTGWHYFQELNDELKEKLFLLIIEYTSTPVKKRGGIKRYKLRFELQHADIATNNQDYLNYCFVTGNYFISNGEDDEVFKTIFTEKEVKELDRKANILTTFTKEEVKDA